MFSIYSDRFILIYCCVLAGIIGAVFGSFLNCTAWRVAHGESFIKGRSHCPSCGHELGILDLFPVISWLLLRGRCRYCGSKISVRYPLTELFFSAMTILCLLRFDLTPECLRNYIFGCCLFCLALTDIEEMIIPDGTLIISVLAFAIAAPFMDMSLKTIGMRVCAGLVYGGGMLLLSLLFDHILGRESMGGGDIKLLAVCGLYLGFTGGLFTLLAACILGLLFAYAGKICSGKSQNNESNGVAQEGQEKSMNPGKTSANLKEGQEESMNPGKISAGLKDGMMESDKTSAGLQDETVDSDRSEELSQSQAFPFGPSIAAAAWLMLLYGSFLTEWYLGLLGL